MTQKRTISENPIDELCQLRDELRVVWVALGNGDDAEAYLVQIREHVNGVTNRIEALVRQMQEQPA